MIEVYRGSINTWECDEMGHMNVRFYVARMMEGLAEFAHTLGLDHAFRANGPSTLRPRDQHIRFMREVKPGEPFTMYACVLEVRESSVLIYQQTNHMNGEPSAAYRTWVDHIDISTGFAFPWSAATRARLEGLKGEAPAACAPRSLDMSVEPRASARMVEADAIKAPVIGRGVVLPGQVDLTGAMMPEFFIGRMSDSVGHLLKPWRDKLAKQAEARGEVVRMGGAVLEYRLVYRRWPRSGDRYVIRSGRGFQKEKVHSFVHWIMDPDTGDAWCTAEAVAVALNLETRKIMPATPEMMGALTELAPGGLTV
ncbi:MAG: acyl-ACP thioesterase [Alphaproteobacteria bacterium]|jgi:acyl-CoA thioester hydrolase|nr:MAG: acyl-ACP thioesterase [Alphaproteobacteria bacterium]